MLAFEILCPYLLFLHFWIVHFLILNKASFLQFDVGYYNVCFFAPVDLGIHHLNCKLSNIGYSLKSLLDFLILWSFGGLNLVFSISQSCQFLCHRLLLPMNLLMHISTSHVLFICAPPLISLVLPPTNSLFYDLHHWASEKYWDILRTWIKQERRMLTRLQKVKRERKRLNCHVMISWIVYLIEHICVKKKCRFKLCGEDLHAV